jgi:hypothetical protein
MFYKQSLEISETWLGGTHWLTGSICFKGFCCGGSRHPPSTKDKLNKCLNIYKWIYNFCYEGYYG